MNGINYFIMFCRCDYRRFFSKICHQDTRKQNICNIPLLPCNNIAAKLTILNRSLYVTMKISKSFSRVTKTTPF